MRRVHAGFVWSGQVMNADNAGHEDEADGRQQGPSGAEDKVRLHRNF